MTVVVAGLVPAIHPLLVTVNDAVDAQHKARHDEPKGSDT
jgi:hypothetical protein